jgi:V/A-type H+-transporting ATPase subunit K
MYIIVPVLILAILSIPLILAYRNMKTGKKLGNAKRSVVINLSAFAAICLLAIVFPLGGLVGAATTATATSTSVGAGISYIAAALSTGLACLGAGLAVANGSAAAIGAVTEDPKVFGRAMIFVVLGEGIAVYGLIVSFLIIGAVH